MNNVFRVRYEDNSGNEDGINEYVTEKEAEESIEEELNTLKDLFSNYDYGDFGRKTEIWESGGEKWALWERLW